MRFKFVRISIKVLFCFSLPIYKSILNVVLIAMALFGLEYVALVTTHVILSPLSGLLLLLGALIILFRDRSSRINRLFFVFLASYGLYQIFDGLMYLALFLEKDQILANIYRDLSMVFYLLGLIFGSLSILTIYHGNEYLDRRRNLITWSAATVVLVLLAILFDSASVSGQTQERQLLGWLSIVGGFVVFAGIIIGYQWKILQDAVNPQVERRIKSLFVGTSLMIVILFVFDITFVLLSIDIIYQILTNDIIHSLVHLVVLTGVGLIVKTLWSPLAAKK